MVVAKVFELDNALRPLLVNRLEKFLDEVVVLLTADTGVLVSEVQRIVEITFGVRADVEDNRQRAAGINTGAGGVKGELADRNAHAVDAEVAEAENTLAVSHDDHVDRFLRKILEDLAHVALVFDRQVEALREAEEVAELLADFADRRRIDERQHFFDVLEEQSEVQRFIAGPKPIEEERLLERRIKRAELFHHGFDLHRDRGRNRRKESLQMEGSALFFRVGGSLAINSVLQQRSTG